MEGESVEKQKSKTKHSCIICGKKFQKRNALLIHERVHTGDKPYECKICKKTFSQSIHLATHKRIHTGEKPYECELCKKTFSQIGHLAKHKKIHTADSSALSTFKFSFVDCGESIKEEDIKEEVKDEESDNDPLTIHQEIANSNFVCEDIKKGNLIMHMLKIHTRVHTGEILFSCSVCHKSYAKISKLSKHYKTAAHI
jgi:KRAB domain-containing zinc finger protein